MRGLIREADRHWMAAALKVAGKDAGAKGQGGEDAETVPEKEATAEISQSLAERLAAHRTAALQVVLSRNTPVALAALAHVLVARVFGDA